MQNILSHTSELCYWMNKMDGNPAGIIKLRLTILCCTSNVCKLQIFLISYSAN